MKSKFTRKILRLVILSTFALTLAAITQAPILASSGSSSGASAIAGFFSIVLTCCIGIFTVFIPLIVIVCYVINLILIIDVFSRDFGKNNTEAAIWVVVLLFLGFPVGTLLYYVLVMQKYPKK